MTITVKNPLTVIKNRIAERKLPDEIVTYLMFEDGTVVKCTTFPKLKF